MKKLFIASLAVFLLAGCSLTEDNSELSTKAVGTTTFHINETTTKDALQGKPSVIVFGGTYCPHCVAAVPVFKEQIADVYADQVNIWINVIDKKKFEVDVPQGFNPNFTFEGLAQKECGYVPSWVVLNRDLNPILSSCGTEKTIEDMEIALKLVL